MLDARSGRDPTYSKHGECRGAESKVLPLLLLLVLVLVLVVLLLLLLLVLRLVLLQMLSDSQWTWLEERLLLQSEVTVIGSGIQVLPCR